MTDSQAKSQQPASTKLVVEDEIDLIDYLRVIWHHRWMIVVLCLVAMSLSVTMSLRKPRKYESNATIMPPLDILQRESGGGLLSLNSSLLQQVMNTTATILGTYVEILQSREVADAIIDRLHLMPTDDKTPCRSAVRNDLKASTKIATTNGGAVKITVTDTDPNRAAAVANAYVEELDKRNKKLSSGQATSKRIFLENRLKEVESKLAKIDNLLGREAKTQEMLYDMLTQQYELAKMEEAKSMPTIQVLDRPLVPELGMGRGTVRKGVLAGVAAFMLGIFLAFGCEYVVRARHRDGKTTLT